jgi:hypothetical protein
LPVAALAALSNAARAESAESAAAISRAERPARAAAATRRCASRIRRNAVSGRRFFIRVPSFLAVGLSPSRAKMMSPTRLRSRV